MSSVQNDVPITIQEAMCFWDKSKKQVYWAIWREQVKARQSVCSENWILSYNSCVDLWGAPSMTDLAVSVLEDWHGNKNIRD